MEKMILATRPVRGKDEAVQTKLKAVQPKILGIPLVRYQVQSLRHVWVPCAYVVYRWQAGGGGSLRPARSGRIAAVYDANEDHASIYELMSEGDLPLLTQPARPDEITVLPRSHGPEDAAARSEEAIRFQYLMKVLRIAHADLYQQQYTEFCREAWQLSLEYKNKHFTKYAYLDDFGITSVQARGLGQSLSSRT